MIPGANKMLGDEEIDEDAFKNIEVIISSMTPKERSFPDLLNSSRKNRIASGSGNDIAIVTGAVVGGVIGYYSTVKLGEHNGFQYTIVLDETKDSVTIVQGKSDDKNYNFKVSDRVTIIYGNQIRVVKTNN